ncbi:MAG: chemotaxis protein CheW [Halobacteriaceae archaeon]
MATTETQTTTEGAQVLEFRLGAERYCVDIEYVAEIVDTGDLTTIPNSPRHIEGVMDLRGRTTSIVNPKRILDVSGDGEERRIVVFDPDSTDGDATGWLVDEVYQVVRVDTTEVDDPPVDGTDAIVGVVKRESDFVIWLDPDDLTS